MKDILTVILLVIGGGLSLLAAVAVVRFPDLYTRMHGSAKCATFGVGCILLAVAVAFGETATTTQVMLVICFLLLTAPIAAHMIGRSGYRLNVPRWHGTVMDEPRPEERAKQADGRL
ncbi:MAG: monovalent cation/H(+) antiporter subunit G [Pirellulaceae bacterium]